MEKGELITAKAFPIINYDLHLISAGEEIIFWDNKLRMENMIEGMKYSKLLDLYNGRMAATKENGEIDIINYYSREIEFTLEGHTELIVAICGIDTGNIGEHIIATAAYDNSIRIWNLLNRECINVINVAEEVGNIYSIIYDQRRGYLLNSTYGFVTIRNYKTLEIIREINHGRARIIQLLQINEEQIISICHLSELSLRIWNMDSGETIRNINIPDTKGFLCGALLDKSTLLLGEADTGKVYTVNLNTYQIINNYKIHQEYQSITQICILNPTEAISCSKYNTIKFFDIKTGNVKITLNEHNSEVNSILPVLFPSNVKYENISHIPKEYIIQIGEYSCTIDGHLFHRISPKFRFNIHQRAENIILIEYMDPNISFNHVFKPFIDNKLIIKEEYLAEAIILGKYFPMIKIQYENYIKLHSANLIEVFNINKGNAQLWNDIFTDQDKSKYYFYNNFIYIYI